MFSEKTNKRKREPLAGMANSASSPEPEFLRGERRFPSKKQSLRLPNGESAVGCDPIQAHYQWALALAAKWKEEGARREVRFVGIGRPSAPLAQSIFQAALTYWKEIGEDATTIPQATKGASYKALLAARQQLLQGRLPDEQTTPVLKRRKSLHIYEESKLRESTAGGFNKFYGISASSTNSSTNGEAISIQPQGILPVQGGGAALHIFFKYLRSFNPEGYIVLKVPYYTLYTGPQHQNKLLPFHLIKSQDSSLPVASGLMTLEAAIKEAENNGKVINAVLLCNPNNPTGEVISEEEWEHIIELLKNKQCYIAVDEAYSELNFTDKPSLLEVIYKKIQAVNSTQRLDSSEAGEEQISQLEGYQKLLERTLIFRSGTKGLSAAGERLGVVIGFCSELMNKLKSENLYIGNPPKSAQVAYAAAVGNFNGRNVDTELESLRKFYEAQVRYVEEKFKEMGIGMINVQARHVKVEGTFYVLGNFKSLIGKFKITDANILKELREKVGLTLKNDQLETDVDIAYYLLFAKGIMITPLSFFGWPAEEGILRMTCSQGQTLLDEVLGGIRAILKEAQNEKDIGFLSDIGLEVPLLSSEADDLGITMEISKEESNAHFFHTRKEEDNLEKNHLTPPEIFAEMMRGFWKRYRKKSESIKAIRNKGKNTFNFMEIEAIVKEDASIDYGHPQGDMVARGLIGDALSSWYGREVKPENILICSVSPFALLKNVLDKNIFHWKKGSNATAKAIILDNPFEDLGGDIDKETLQTVIQNVEAYLASNTQGFIIIDERFVERCFNGELPLGKRSLITLLRDIIDFNRVVLIRSSEFYSGKHDNIYTIVTENTELMAALLKESINMHVHSPRSLEEGYARTLHYVTISLLQDTSFRNYYAHYAAEVRKYVLSKNLEEARLQFLANNEVVAIKKKQQQEATEKWVLPAYSPEQYLLHTYGNFKNCKKAKEHGATSPMEARGLGKLPRSPAPLF